MYKLSHFFIYYSIIVNYWTSIIIIEYTMKRVVFQIMDIHFNNEIKTCIL